MSRLAVIVASILVVACSTTPGTPAKSANTASQNPYFAKMDAEGLTFDAWLNVFRDYAIAEGIAPNILDTAFAGIRLNDSIIQSDAKQPEFERQIWEYLNGAVSDYRLQKGREKLGQNQSLLNDVQSTYGVSKHTITAIWGLESSFGAVMGDRNIIEALATLAYRGRRTDFGRRELLAALTILNEGYANKSQMVGSWAGGMGQTQFIPSTYLGYAVDYDKDGKKNLWGNLGDVFASTANYLSQSGWRAGENWGREVVLPTGFDYSLGDKTIVKSVAQWEAMGVTAVPGASLQGDANRVASLLIPAGYQGPAFLIYPNFQAILKYNNSTAYALAIGHLSDRLSGSAPIHGTWPVNEKGLSRNQRIELQDLLTFLGYEPGVVDGIVGANTRRAVRLFQQDNSLPADGFVTQRLLAYVREAAQ